MDFRNLFDCFDLNGRLLLPDNAISFQEIPWSAHPEFEGVALKHIVSSSHTGGEFSYHLVKIAPGKKIGSHVHSKQLETHEIIAGSGTCLNAGVPLIYEPGVISIFPAGLPHEVSAGPDGLFLFAKFIPALA